MTEYERKWLSFIEETKATDTGILNEYVSDIINTAKSIAAAAKGQGTPSPLSGLGRGNVKTKKEVPATAGATAEPEPVPVAAAPKPEYVYDYFGDHLQKVKNREEYKRLEKVHKKKYDGRANFEEDLYAFMQVIGPFKSKYLYTEIAESAGDNKASKIDKLADTDLLRSRERDVSAALKKLPDDHGAIRIIRSMPNKHPEIIKISSIIVHYIQRKPPATE